MNLVVLSFGFLLAVEPSLDDLESSYQSLKQAETRKDAGAVKQLATQVCGLARQIVSTPAPEGENEKTAWTNQVAYAREVMVHAEYALYTTAIQSPAAVTVELLAALEQASPKSKYMDEGYGRYLLALNQTGAGAKIPGVAEKALVNFPENEDLLLVLTDTAFTRQQGDRALAYGRRLVNVLSKHGKPDGVSAADWERKRTAALSRGQWIVGVLCGERNLYAESDRNLRAALPLIKGNDAMAAPALFYLGVVNFQLGQTTLNKARVLEAAKFSEQAAAYPGPYAAQAWRNAQISKTAAERMR